MEKHLLLALLIPAVFLIATGLVKSLVTRGLLWSNFYLGIDLALTALANGIVNIVDISSGLAQQQTSRNVADPASRMFNNAIMLLAAVGALFLVLVIHKEIDERGLRRSHPAFRRVRGIWLGVVANLIGGAALIMFIFYRLKGQL